MAKTMTDVTIHRMVLEDKDTLGIYIMPGGHHIGHFAEEYEKANKPMPVTINIGLRLQAITIGATFEPPTTPLGYDEARSCRSHCAKNPCNWFRL